MKTEKFILNEFQSLFAAHLELDRINDEMFKVLSSLPSEAKEALYKKIFSLILISALTSYRSISILCSRGYGQPSLILLRALFESLVSAQYMLLGDDNSMNNLAERFELYQWKEKKDVLDYWKNSPSTESKLRKIVMSQEITITDKFELFKKRFNITDKRSLSTWSGVPFWKMAKETGFFDQYNILYTICSGISHSSFQGIKNMAYHSDNDVLFSAAPSTKHIGLNLTRSMQYFVNLMSITNTLFELKMTKEIDSFCAKVRKISSKKYPD
jgi:hypothetical protein